MATESLGALCGHKQVFERLCEYVEYNPELHGIDVQTVTTEKTSFHCSHSLVGSLRAIDAPSPEPTPSITAVFAIRLLGRTTANYSGRGDEWHQHGPPLSISTDRCRYTSPPLNCDVLSLEFFSCTGCETVYADIEEPPICDVCESRQFTTIESEAQARSYFTRS